MNLVEILKVIEELNPDILILQEMPKPNYGSRFINYVASMPVESHSGYTAVFAKKGKFRLLSSQTLSGSVISKLEDDQFKFYVVGTHLLPYKEYEEQRLLQLAHILLTVAQDEELPMVIAGDMNMRESETKKIMDLGLVDAFIDIGSPKEHKFSWNSKVNKHLKESFEFSARFDRVFVRDCKVISFQLVANVPVSEIPTHFLSDHFAIYLTIEINTRDADTISNLEDFF